MKHNYNLKKTLGIVVFLVMLSSAFAQSPGGVSASAWYKADAQTTVFSDAGTTNATDNSTVQQWNEYLGTGHNLIQNTTGARPMYSNTTTLVNFNPTVTYNLDYLEYQPATGVNIIDRTQGTLYVAGYFNTVGAAGIMGFDATMDYPGLHTSNNGLDNLLFYTGGPGYQGLSTNSFTDNNYFISGANWTNGAGSTSAYASSIVSLNGLRSSYNTNELQNAVINSASRDIRVGRDSNWGGMNGQVNEVIIFENALSMAEMDRVESYLAIKYGNTYAQGNDDYVNAAGAIVWTADATYNNNIFGIARDDVSELYQKQSKSTNQNQQLIIGAGNGLFNTNAANSNTLTNGQFLMVGDNGLVQSLTTPLAYTGGANGDTNFRFESIWKVQNTSGVGQITVAWPVGVNNLYVVQSTDETFDGSDNFTAMDNPIVTINGVDYNTTTVNLADGEYFTLAGFAYAPGGVVGPDFWVKSDDAGTIATAWKDHSANADDIPNVGGMTLPAADRAHNFHPYTTGYTGSSYFYNDVSVLNPTNGLLSDVSHSIFSAVRPATAGQGRIVGIDDTSGYASEPAFSMEDGELRFYKFSGGANADQFTEEPFKIGAVNVVSGIGNNPIAAGGTSTSAGGERILGVNGVYKTYPNTNASNRFHFNGQHLRVGEGAWSAPGAFPGDIMEVIWYKRPLTAIEQSRVNSYLAIKNGASLAENYLDSNSNVVWDITTNTGYNNHIFGVVRDNISALHQKQAASTDVNQKLVIGNGSTLFDTNAANTNDLTDGQFLMVGDNSLKQSLATPLTYTAGSNGETNFRFESIWKVQNTNSVGTVTVAWPIGISNLYVVQSTDETFDDTDAFTEMDNTVTINGVDYNTATVTLVDGQYFTFAGYGYAPAGVVNSLSYWYRADKNATNTGAGTDVTDWTDFFSGTVVSQMGTNGLPDYVEGAVDYFNYNPGVNFTAGTQTLGNNTVRTLTSLDYDIFTLTKEGMANGGANPRYFSIAQDNSGAVSNAIMDAYGLMPNGLNVERRPIGAGTQFPAINPGFATDIPSIMYHTNTNTTTTKGLNGDGFGSSQTYNAQGEQFGGHFFGDSQFAGNGSDNRGFIGHIGETIIYGSGSLTTEERRRVDSYLAIKYGITLGRVDTDHYLGSTASATSIIWNGADNTAYNNNIFGMARSDIGGFEQKVSKSVNTGTILTLATDDDYALSNIDASRTSFTSDEAYILFGDNEATGETSLATDPCTGEPLNPAVSTTNRVWRVENTNTSNAVWLQADLNAYTFNTDIELWVADDENFTTNLVKVSAASYTSGIATFNALFSEGVKYIKFAGVVTPSQCDVCTGGTFIFKTGRSWNTLAERTNNVMDSETTGTSDQGDLIVDMDVADPANVEYGPNSTPRPYGRWMISRRYDNQNVALTHTINLNQAVAGASLQISNINTYLNNANRFTVEGYDCDGNLVLPKITDAFAPSTATTYEIQGNEVVGTKPYRGLASLYSTANVRFDRVIQSIVIIAEVDRTNTRNTLRSLNIGDISFECAVPLPPTEDNVTMVQDFTQSEDVPTCLETTMRMRFVNSNCDTRTVNISQTLPAGLEFVNDTYNDSEFTTPPAYTYNANTFTLNGLELPSGTNYLYINVRSTAGTTTTYNTSSSFTVQETGNPYNSIDPAGNADSQVSFEASNYTAPDIDLLYTVDATCLTEGDQVTYTLNFDNQEASAITGATLKVYYALGQEISSVTLNNGITGVHGFGPAGESYIEMTNVTIPTGTSSIDVLMDITSDIFTDEPTASSVFQLITEPGNACAEENPTMLSKALTLEDCSHVEVCTEEVEGETFSSNGGIPITFNQPATNYGFQFDIYALDNSFNMEINGVQLATQEIEFQSAGTSGINVRFADGDEYETNTPAIWQMSGTASAPLIRVVIAPNGDVSMYGSKTSGGALHPLELFNGNSFNSISWNDGAPNTIVATQSVVSTTYINGRGSGLNEVPCSENYCVTGDCNPNTFLNTSDPNTIEYDNMVSNYHSTMMRDAITGALMVWGERMANDGNGHVLSPTEVNSTNYPALTGDILKYTSGGRNLGYGQSIILTTDGLFVWGLEGSLIHGDLTTSRAFQQVTIGTFGINGGTPKADGLPDGVAPEDVKMLFGSYRTLALTTCYGESWVLALSTDGNKYGDGVTDSTTNDQLWHRVHIDATTTLDNVVAMRGNRISQMALTSTGEVYTWGTNTLLGNGTGIANRLFATQMTLPTGVTPKMIGATIGGTATLGELYTTYYVLGTNGNVYAMGEGSNKQLGNFTMTDSNIWVQVQKSATPGDYLTNVTWISPNEHDGYGRYNVNSGINVLTTDGRLWAWGGNSYQMIGGGTPNYIDPTEMPGSIPQGDPYDIGKLNWTDKVIAVETGGHTSMVVKDNSKKYGYVGHRISGSMGDGDPADEQEPVYNFADTPEIDLCGAPVDTFCTQPGATVTPTEFTKVGISDRDGAVGAWPGNVPNGFIAMQSANSGFVITRVQQVSDIANPVEGMLVYEIQDECIKLYNGTDWNCIERSCNE